MQFSTSMNIDKLAQLEGKVSRQWGRRLHELNKYKSILIDYETKVSESSCENEESPNELLYRLGIVLLYSHWEGFIKETAKAYMQCFKGEKIKDVPLSIVIAYYIKTHDKYNTKCNAYECGKSVLEDMDGDKPIQCDIEDLVSTESNLDADVLSKIASFLNIGNDWFELRNNYINNFVACRNGIAHGEVRQVSKEEFEEYFDGIVNLIMLYKEKLLTSN